MHGRMLNCTCAPVSASYATTRKHEPLFSQIAAIQVSSEVTRRRCAADSKELRLLAWLREMQLRRSVILKGVGIQKIKHWFKQAIKTLRIHSLSPSICLLQNHPSMACCGLDMDLRCKKYPLAVMPLTKTCNYTIKCRIVKIIQIIT